MLPRLRTGQRDNVMAAAAKQMMISEGGGKNDGPILAVSVPKFTKFWDDVGDTSL